MGTSPLNHLLELVTRMTGDELAVVISVAEGLDQGRAQYGPLTVDDGHDWLEEAVQEARDKAVYLTAELLQLKRRKAQAGTGTPSTNANYPYPPVVDGRAA